MLDVVPLGAYPQYCEGRRCAAMALASTRLPALLDAVMPLRLPSVLSPLLVLGLVPMSMPTAAVLHTPVCCPPLRPPLLLVLVLAPTLLPPFPPALLFLSPTLLLLVLLPSVWTDTELAAGWWVSVEEYVGSACVCRAVSADAVSVCAWEAVEPVGAISTAPSRSSSLAGPARCSPSPPSGC